MEQKSKNKENMDGYRRSGMMVRTGDAVVIGVILALMLVAGTFLDFDISSSLYDPQSRFGMLLAAYGQLPSSAGAVMAGTLFFIGRSRRNRAARIWETVIGLVMMGVGIYMLCENPVEYMNMNLVLSCLIALVITILMMALAVFVSQNASKEDVLLVAAIFLLTILAQMVIINLIKIPWGRPRMRLIETDSRAYFMPWYEPGTALKDTLVAAGVEAEEFKSFPSGHTGHAVMLMLYGLLPWLHKDADRECGTDKCRAKGEEKEKLAMVPSVRLFIWIGFGWTLLVAFSRMIMGAHFLSDTAVGAGISFLCVLVIPVIVCRYWKWKE